VNRALARDRLLEQALRLEYFTVGWNVLEGLVAVVAALAAGSVALLGFGIDSFVESASGGVLVWRLRCERHSPGSCDVEELEHRALRWVGASLCCLAAYVAIDAAWTLWTREEPRPTTVGLALGVVSIVVMYWLARSKRRVARGLDSRALAADSFQTTACFWLSVILIGGVGLNAALGWWWADPVAALGMTYFLVREGIGAWRGESQCSSC
jgi:divalent metal cation (Fe/Co/Zn/Cd) transporter